MTLDEKINTFLQTGPYAVVGASQNRDKYGNKVLRCYLQHNLKAYPINPRETEIEGQNTYPDLASLPEPVERISVITPPSITEYIVEQAATAGIKHVWMQPGAESPNAVERAEALGINVIPGTACLLVALGYTEKNG
ncbi:MAG: CoA-binding protein [bacterium]|nr:CoA-binding protein [bacterium]